MNIQDWKSAPPADADAAEDSGSQYDPPPAYSSHLSRGDPRSNSTQSLVPSLSNYDGASKRRLLVVYIHGFMGTDHSFQSFPAHVHRYLRDALVDTHVVHSKIYPRYKTYKAIEVARDNFSRWLQPHESSTTDVVLVGHSMGGLLAADVALMQSWDQNSPNYFQNRILGTVNLDAPLLGLHPGIIVAGLSSLFRSKTDTPKPPGDSTQGTSSITSPEPSLHSDLASSTPTSPSSDPPTSVPGLPPRMTMDPNFDPEFPNDVRLKDRSWWKNIVHFVKKHNSEGIIDAASHHIMSHLEFGSVLMDFNCLKVRYENLRKLEDIDDIKNHGFPHVPPQVRFVQYYTVCYGHPKKPKVSKEMDAADRKQIEKAMADGPGSAGGSKSSTPRASIGDVRDDGRKWPSRGSLPDIPKENAVAGPSRDTDHQSVSSLEMMDPVPMEDEDDNSDKAEDAGHRQSEQSADEETSGHTAAEEKSSAAQERKSGDETAGAGPSSQATEGANEDPDMDAAAKELSELELSLPKVPDLPEKPEPFDSTKYTDKDARKQAEKESKRVHKAYEQTVKNREKTIKERQKIIDKRKKKLASEAAKREKEAKKQASEAEKRGKEAEKEAKEQSRKDSEAVQETEKRGKETEKEAKEQRQKNEEAIQILADGIEERQNSLADTAAAVAPRPSAGATGARADRSISHTPAAEGEASLSRVSSSESESPRSAKKEQKKAEKPPKPLKERKFCTLPSKVKGQLDPKWIKVFMKDMDEVEAHTSLFFPGPHYDKLVGDMGDMIISWVQEDATKRAIWDMG
ncbi:Reticulocyte-binding protein 2-like protein a [Apiospora kogelbergensis]|uniref:Reticulocyte-binding protein 2-like protein a n=1 Tax=Apiospora kogelbergensis TaxID=1337665 RepID=A0AAW0QNJ5_9PEZI